MPQLKRVPTGIQHLKKLQGLYFIKLPNEFVQNIGPSGVRALDHQTSAPRASYLMAIVLHISI